MVDKLYFQNQTVNVQKIYFKTLLLSNVLWSLTISVKLLFRILNYTALPPYHHYITDIFIQKSMILFNVPLMKVLAVWIMLENGCPFILSDVSNIR